MLSNVQEYRLKSNKYKLLKWRHNLWVSVLRETFAGAKWIQSEQLQTVSLSSDVIYGF